ncbi:MAG: NAD(P)H-dependent oxidoreductase subunit E [Pseudonocardia sp.]|nr:NAD(P)H-dependent oxidoreductase subunit E [Pseudonocardia sp.]
MWLDGSASRPRTPTGVATFYAMFSTVPRPRRVVHVCDDIACGPFGGEEIVSRLGGALDPAEAAVVRSPCLGLCERAPAVLFQLVGEPDFSQARRAPPRYWRRSPHPAPHPAPLPRSPSPPPRVPTVRSTTPRSAPRRPAAAIRACGCSAASVSWIPRASTTTGPTAATRPCAVPSTSARPG